MLPSRRSGEAHLPLLGDQRPPRPPDLQQPPPLAPRHASPQPYASHKQCTFLNLTGAASPASRIHSLTSKAPSGPPPLLPVSQEAHQPHPHHPPAQAAPLRQVLAVQGRIVLLVNTTRTGQLTESRPQIGLESRASIRP